MLREKLIVAVVDDDVRLLESLRDLLSLRTMQSDQFVSAASLLADEAALTEIDCLIADIGMPAIDGFELEKSMVRLRPEVPVILITGRHEIADQQRAIAQGGRFFRKPFDGQALLTAIGEALQKADGGK